MQMLYDSDTFLVVHMDANLGDVSAKPRPGFEIVDKRANKEVYLDGPWAAIFQAQMAAWQEKTPEQSEVEATLDSYCTLAQYPLDLH